MKTLEMNKGRAGMILGAFLGSFHLLWSVVVALGFAQPMLDFVYKIHFLNNPFTVQAFNLGNAAMLVVVTTLIGFVFGWFLALLWNMLKN